MSKLLKTALLVLAASAILNGPAQAGYDGLKNVSFSAEPVGGPLSLVFKSENGKWILGKGGSKNKVRFHVKAEHQRRFRIHHWQIRNREFKKPITKTDNFSAEKIDKVVVHKMRAYELQPYVEMGRNICEQEGGDNEIFKKKILSSPEYAFTVRAKTPKGHYHDTGWINKKVPLQITCLPEPLKVKNIDMTVKYKKLPGKCHVKAHLQAVIKTNKKSKQNVSFWYYRDNGDRQKVTIKTQNTGIAYFNKHYTFKKPESRKYLINVGGDHPYQTKWTPVKVNCAGSHTGGFQTAPKPNTH